MFLESCNVQPNFMVFLGSYWIIGLLEDIRSSPAISSPLNLAGPISGSVYCGEQMHQQDPRILSHNTHPNHQAFIDHQHHLLAQQQQHQQDGVQSHPRQQHMQMMMSMMKLPTSAGDNGSSSDVDGRGKSGGGGPLPASVTALFNAAAASSAGGSNACKWKPPGLQCSVDLLESSSFFTDSGRVCVWKEMALPLC